MMIITNALLICTCVGNGLFSSAVQTPESNILSGISLGSMNTFLRTIGNVFHLDDDAFTPGNILYSVNHRLMTTNGQITEVVAGSHHGYLEGNSTRPAEFKWIRGFVQINSTAVLVVDSGNHCLRMASRLSNMTLLVAGNCTSFGFKDGQNDRAHFFSPETALKYGNTSDMVIVLDRMNKALRSVGLLTGKVTTLIKDLPSDPRGAVYGSSQEELFITFYNYLARLNLKTLALNPLILQSNTIGINGDSTAPFTFATNIIKLSADILLTTDFGSGQIKIVDIKERKISSICGSASVPIDGPITKCSLKYPVSLMLRNDTLFIGENMAIRSITANNLRSCGFKDISAKVTNGEKSCIEVLPNINICYQPGVHQFKIPGTNCTIQITVTKETCPSAITEYGDPKTKMAEVRLPGGDKIGLPFGRYVFQKALSENETCNISVHVTDPRLRRRLDITAAYKLSCNQFSANKDLVLATARARYSQIKQMSSGKCNQSLLDAVTATCGNDTLQVVWPTDCLHDAKQTKEQEGLIQIINNYLQRNRAALLELVIPSRQPPIVMPLLNTQGLPASVALSPFCSGGLRYIAASELCE